MRAVRADAVDVLQAEDAIAIVLAARVVPVVLGAQARELAGIPVEHDRDAIGTAALASSPPGDQRVMRRAGVERVVAQARAPARQELIHALQIPARLRAAIAVGEVQPVVSNEQSPVSPRRMYSPCTLSWRRGEGVHLSTASTTQVRDLPVNEFDQRQAELVDGLERAVLGALVEIGGAGAPAG